MKMMGEEQRQRLLYGSVEMLEKLRDSINNCKTQKTILLESKEFNQFYLFVLVINCDAQAIVKQFCTINQKWEEIVLKRQMYIFLRESSNKIIGTLNNSKNGKKNSKKIYWSTELKAFIEKRYPELMFEFNEIDTTLQSYIGNEFQEDIRVLRNLSVHYDDELDTMKFIDTVNQINLDFAFQLLGKWLTIVGALYQFVTKIIIQKNN